MENSKEKMDIDVGARQRYNDETFNSPSYVHSVKFHEKKKNKKTNSWTQDSTEKKIKLNII